MKISNSSIHNSIKFNISRRVPVFTTISISITRKDAMGLIAISIFRKEEEALNSQVLNAVEAEDKDKRGLVHAIGVVFIKMRFIRAIIATRSNLDPLERRRKQGALATRIRFNCMNRSRLFVV